MVVPMHVTTISCIMYFPEIGGETEVGNDEENDKAVSKVRMHGDDGDDTTN